LNLDNPNTTHPDHKLFGRRGNYWALAILIVILATTLASCSGRRLTSSSWPGITVDDNLAYIAFNQFVYVVDPIEQRVIGQYPSEAQNNATFYAAPAVTDGILVVGGYDKILYGIDRETLRAKWSFHRSSDRYVGSPVVLGDMVFAVTAGNELFALDLAELDELGTIEKADEARRSAEEAAVAWEFIADHGFWSAPLVTSDTLYVTSLDHNVDALDTETGREMWTSELPGAMGGSPVLSTDGESLYVGNFDYSLYALDATTGEQLWRVEAENWVWGRPVLAAEKLFFGDLGGYLYAVNPSNGEVLWKEQVADAIRGGPTFDPASNRIYISGRKVPNPGGVTTRGFVMALDADDYRTVWQETTEEAIYTSPVLAGEVLLIAPAQGETLLQVFNAETGVKSWKFVPNPEE